MKKQYLLLVMAMGALVVRADNAGQGDYKVVHSLQDVIKKKVKDLDGMIKDAMHHAVDNALKPEYVRVHRSAEDVMDLCKKLDELAKICAKKGGNSCRMTKIIEQQMSDLNNARGYLYEDTMKFAEKHGEKALIEKAKSQLKDIKTAITDFDKEVKTFDQNYGMQADK